ncbi:autotransporter assembly complex family protein [Caulobacter mirabilis]|uniref:autotransporter assembly complex protein TamA n=1 Tax=Caulobacter mirabilis TaxID=69666 RepID=UPI0031838EB2
MALVVSTAIALCAWAGAATAQQAKAKVEGVADDDLREAIQRAVGDSKSPATTRFEARRRARSAADDAIAALRTQGYYGYQVEPDVVDPDEDDGGQPPSAVVKVTPGPRFRFAGAGVAWVGDEPTPEVAIAAEQAMALRRGAPGRAADVLSAEGRILAALQKRGYADAAPAPREVIIDHADNTVRPTFRMAAGDLIHMDGLIFGETGRTDQAWLRRLAPWKEGEVYDPEDMAELERRLLDTGVYDSVSVSLEPKDKVDAQGRRPVLVSVVDRPRRTLEASAGYSTSEGAGLDLRRTRYNRFGRADTQTYALRLAELEQRLEGKVALPHWRRPQQTLTMGAGVYNERTDAYDATGVQANADITRRWRKTSYVTLGVSLDASSSAQKQKIDNETIRGERSNILTAAVLGAFALDRSDDPLNPTKGWRVEARAEPTGTLGDSEAAYLRFQTQGSIYLSLDEEAKTVLAGRLKAGAILGATLDQVAAPRRFYSGGGGSVRGYAWQAVGPRLFDNTPQGGMSVLEGSFEVRRKITERWGGVAFVDVGGIGDQTFPSGDDFSVGAGFGVRYDLGFGPIRADIAFPLNKREGDADFQLYISIGQSF